MDVLGALSSPNHDIRRKTLAIVLDLIIPQNINEVVLTSKREVVKTQTRELEKDGEYRQMLIQAIHSCAVKFPEVVGTVLHMLTDFLGDSNVASAMDRILSWTGLFLWNSAGHMVALASKLEERPIWPVDIFKARLKRISSLHVKGKYDKPFALALIDVNSEATVSTRIKASMGEVWELGNMSPSCYMGLLHNSSFSTYQCAYDLIETKVDDWEFKGLFGVLLVDNVEEQSGIRKTSRSETTTRRVKKRLGVRRNVRSKKAIRGEATIRSEKTIRSERTLESEKNRSEVKRPFEVRKDVYKK
ncbi:coatomer subunit beta-1 [Tanacetum coccineum]|uniref:Coatomer subunit beta-1 n=1 Tax=Tanacetum coccineum TaxID=301880 RepID=A0ABQ4ZY55_9ASTR